MDFQKNAEDLKRRATNNNGRSLQTNLESILEAHTRLSNKAEARALVERIRNRIAARPQTDSGTLQAEDRQ